MSLPWVAVLRSVIRAGTSLLLGTLGGIYVEKSGVMNLGAEGIIIIGAVSAFIVSKETGNPFLGVAAAVLASLAISMVYGMVVITFRANQVVSGLAVVMLGLGLSSLLGRKYVGFAAPHIAAVQLYYLSDIPVIGQVFFSHDPLVYMSYALAPVLWFVLYQTRFGLAVRAVGESPESAEAAGVNVIRTRYACVALGGVLMGLSGAYLSLVYIPAWTEGITSGRGWIIVALTIASAWDPLRAVIGSYLYGGIEVLQFHLQPLGVPAAILAMTPYIVAIIMVCLLSVESIRVRMRPPAALGIPYRRE